MIKILVVLLYYGFKTHSCSTKFIEEVITNNYNQDLSTSMIKANQGF